MDVWRCNIRALDILVITSKFFCEFFGEIGLAASRGAIKQQPVRHMESKSFCLLWVFQQIYNIRLKLFLKFHHSGNISESVPSLLLLACFTNLRGFGTHGDGLELNLSIQSFYELVCVLETAFNIWRQGFYNNGNQMSKTLFFPRIGNS